MSWYRIGILVLVMIVLFGIVIWYYYTRPLYIGPVSAHFDGRQFYYKESNTFRDTIKWLREMEMVIWPDWINDPLQKAPEEYVKMGEIKVTYINHATVLIQVDEVNILTDPIWSERAGWDGRVGVKRIRAPGIAFEDLPRIDVILISHDHFDHLDLPTINQLIKEYNPQILVGLGVKSVIGTKRSSKITEMDWWQDWTLPYTDIKFTFVPARHNSGRSIIGRNRTLWGGFVIEGSGGNIYFAGDTGYDELFLEINKRFGSFQLTILPIGSYEKRWYMIHHHMNPDDAVRAHMTLESLQSIGIHYATFNEHPEQAVDAHEKDLLIALEKYGLPKAKFWVLGFGEGRYVITVDEDEREVE
ncbi:hypothetical protein BHU72_07455 [Desulfuribacillus stibiiarsenatis]|uniref:Metallo-beta-lactamase domain-containing protein n=1 Tax=Desulfuribacillus stibiiarsenatis TaxID=1390249 RepID=A0A1E5L4M8_9FIRM|nr:MBL fold metallo-hydrolase [Desulfuribacillus stibiiarsenatis]OEH85014.1 hypothetical protein BHU72_07455 [Desulfuribacillus stibiiarsenatis]